MRKRLEQIRFRLTVEEKDLMLDNYYDSKYQGTFTAYFRGIILGHIPHPTFEKAEKPPKPAPYKRRRVPNVGRVIGSAETRHHLQAMVLAVEVLRIQQNPEYQDLIKRFPKEFRAMVRLMRGYNFDDDTRLKSPLKGAPKRHPGPTYFEISDF